MEEKTIQYYCIDGTLNLKQLVEDYSKYVFTIIKNMTKDILEDEDLEELISDIFFAIWKNKENIKEQSPLKPYIAGVTKNIAKNRLRTINFVTTVDDEAFEVPSNISLEEEVETKEKMDIVTKELNKMGDDKKIFIMFYSYGMKAKEIGEKLGYTEFNVSTKLHRIKKKLKSVLEERGY